MQEEKYDNNISALFMQFCSVGELGREWIIVLSLYEFIRNSMPQTALIGFMTSFVHVQDAMIVRIYMHFINYNQVLLEEK